MSARIEEAAIKAAIWRWPAAQRYWRARRAKAPAAIAWWIDGDLPATDRAQGLATWQPSGPIIVLARLPESQDMAATVAHELEHFILDSEGWPALGCPSTSPRATRDLVALGNSVLDLPIDDRLRSFGFRLSPPADPGSHPFDRLARQMGYTTPDKMRAVMQRIVDDHPGAGLELHPDTGAYFKRKYEQCQ